MNEQALLWQDMDRRFDRLAGEPFAHWLAGGARAVHHWGSDWQYIVAAPASSFEVRGGAVYIDGDLEGTENPFDLFTHWSDRCRPSHMQAGAPGPLLQSGIVGHVTYEMGRYADPGIDQPGEGGILPDMAFGYYPAVLASHGGTRTQKLVSTTAEAADRLMEALERRPPPPSGRSWERPVSSVDQETYTDAVEAIRSHILAGDIFQANLTRRLRSVTDADLSDLARLFADWQAQSASPFAACLQYDGAVVLSNAPERFFQITPGQDGRRITAEPVKGTRPRQKDEQADRLVRDALMNSEKDRAENIMIADLLRNDLSRTCEDHTIREEQICTLRSFAHVHHLVSVISGILREEVTEGDLFRALFPCGSITGAPKIEAIHILNRIEKRRRGIYCGAIGFIDDRGYADFSVAIRTAEAWRENGETIIEYGTGGGVTLLSDPSAEYTETEDKALSFRQLIGEVVG